MNSVGVSSINDLKNYLQNITPIHNVGTGYSTEMQKQIDDANFSGSVRPYAGHHGKKATRWWESMPTAGMDLTIDKDSLPKVYSKQQYLDFLDEFWQNNMPNVEADKAITQDKWLLIVSNCYYFVSSNFCNVCFLKNEKPFFCFNPTDSGATTISGLNRLQNPEDFVQWISFSNIKCVVPNYTIKEV